ncbi:hypothetical protein D049_3917A, partial [Vibrio parahaemolyticus VPTS-2010]
MLSSEFVKLFVKAL